MKVVLVALNSKYVHTNIALYYLKNKIKDEVEVEILNLNVNDNISNNLNKIMRLKPDVVCFGVYIWNIEDTLRLSSNLKKINPKIIIAYGGPEVSYNPDEVLEKHSSIVDSILIGEAENNIVAFIKDLKEDNLQNKYLLPVKAEDVPSIADDIVINYDGRIVYIETSRGCPFRCSYCLSCINLGVRYFDLDQVKEDLIKILSINVKQIRFIDRTFNSNRKRALEIWQFLIENRKDTIFHFEISASLIDDEAISFLETIPKDIFQFEIGVQSTNEQTLKAINRRYNFAYEKEVIRKLAQIGKINLHTDLIIGLPHENFERFKTTFNDLYSLHSNEIQLGFLKFLKGTDLYEQKEEYGYIYADYPPYEVLQNKFITYEEIAYLKKFETVFNYIYNSKMFLEAIKYLESKFTNYYEMYELITDYFIKNDLIDVKVSYDSIYIHLIKLFNNDKALIQTLTHDFASNFKGTRDWMYNKYDIKEELAKINDKEITKKYKIIILDYNIENGKEEKTVYRIEK